MKIDANVDIARLLDKTLKAQKNLAYSVVQGINATAKQIQQEARDRLNKRFTLRTPQTKQFLERQSAVIKPFASVGQGRLYAEVSVGRRPKLLLAGYEEGDKREPFRGSVIAQPVTGNSARKNFREPVDKQFTFRSLALKAKTVGGEKRYTGRLGTFTIAGVGVFRRLGRGRNGAELLYHYAKMQKLPKKLGWRQAAQGTASRWLDENISRAFLRSLPK